MHNVIRANGLVIAADNSGSVGEKEADHVKVPYETAGYFSARVALMECMAAGGEPFAAVLHNFSGDAAWNKLLTGVQQAAGEAGCLLEVSGSSESNFHMQQSAAGIVIIGRQLPAAAEPEENMQYAVIGRPLVGEEVIREAGSVAPLAVFRRVAGLQGVTAVLPAGSKGIAYKLEQLAGKRGECELDMNKSAGPATCFLVQATPAALEEIRRLTEHVFSVHIKE